jgi:hypothetical protein
VQRTITLSILLDPLLGKSSIMAKLITDDMRRRGSPDIVRLLGYHICNAREDITCSANAFILRLINMLMSSLPAYREWLIPSIAIQSSKAASIPHPPHNVSYFLGKLDRNEIKGRARLVDCFRTCVTQGLLSVTPQPDCTRVILIDSLDEGLTSSMQCGCSIADLVIEILYNASELIPPWLKFVCSSRRVEEIRGRICTISLELTCNDEDLNSDIDEYVRVRLSHIDRQARNYPAFQECKHKSDDSNVSSEVSPRVSAEDAISLTLSKWYENDENKRCTLHQINGNFLFASLILEDVQRGVGQDQHAILSSIPSSLEQ